MSRTKIDKGIGKIMRERMSTPCDNKRELIRRLENLKRSAGDVMYAKIQHLIDDVRLGMK